MQTVSFDEVVERILARDARYHRDAYDFVRIGLEFTQSRMARDEVDPAQHVSGGQLLDGLREFALQEFGPMALTVLESWGIVRGEDFGEIVFQLIEENILRKTETDRREDFSGGYDFGEAFRDPFLPPSRKQQRPVAR